VMRLAGIAPRNESDLGRFGDRAAIFARARFRIDFMEADVCAAFVVDDV
jgi:hypothetical protein